MAVATATEVRPFHVEVPQNAVDDLRRRLQATRWASKELVPDASQGVQSATIQELARYWEADYDPRRLAEQLNAFPQFMTNIDGLDIYFIHVKSRHDDALPLIMTHGWPGSVIEFLEAVGPLTDPTAHGGRAEDAFDVVLPSIPGYGFSQAPSEVGWDQGRIAKAWAGLMKRLGYTRYVAQGGDQGASITDSMARQAPAGLIGIHLNFLSAFPLEAIAAVFGGEVASGVIKRVAFGVIAAMADKERAALDKVSAILMRGYFTEQAQSPQTIGQSLTDSPTGMAAWMLDHDADSYEKISHAFLDNRPTGGLTRENVVDNLTLYWVTGTATSAARLYWENQRTLAASVASGQKPPELKLPVAFTVFPGELFQAPRSWAEKVYPNLIYFNEADRGGHFAAWEQPQLFTEELRKAFRPLR